MYSLKVRIGKMIWYPLQTIQALGIILGILCIVWVGASFVEIWCKNLRTEPIYSAWNYFNFLVR